MFKVLLIDDEKWILEDLKMVISWEELGFSVIGSVQDTRYARRLIRKEHPDLIICDIKMPKEDGIDFLRSLREEGIKTAFIFLTALSEFEYAREALNLNALGYLLKPVEEETLIVELEKVKSYLKEEQRLGMAKKLMEHVPAMDRESDIISHIQEDILENYSEKLQLATYASKYYMNPNYLSQLFKQETGKSFTAYVVSIRLMKAEYLLTETDLTITEISQIVGYTDYGHFSKLFKKYKGISPQNYRNDRT